MGWYVKGQNHRKYRPSKGSKKPTLSPIKNSNTVTMGRFKVANNWIPRPTEFGQKGRFTVTKWSPPISRTK